jgi:hypothetical protein
MRRSARVITVKAEVDVSFDEFGSSVPSDVTVPVSE